MESFYKICCCISKNYRWYEADFHEITGAIPAILLLLDNTNSKVRTRAVGAIHNMSSDPDSIRIIRRKEGIPRLDTDHSSSIPIPAKMKKLYLLVNDMMLVVLIPQIDRTSKGSPACNLWLSSWGATECLKRSSVTIYHSRLGSCSTTY